jgi:hypothetical protein
VVDAPMMMMVARKVFFLPTRSPRRPNTNAPKGRTANPAAKVSSAKMNALVSLIPAKNCFEMTAASEP